MADERRQHVDQLEQMAHQWNVAQAGIESDFKQLSAVADDPEAMAIGQSNPAAFSELRRLCSTFGNDIWANEPENPETTQDDAEKAIKYEVAKRQAAFDALCEQHVAISHFKDQFETALNNLATNLKSTFTARVETRSELNRLQQQAALELMRKPYDPQKDSSVTIKTDDKTGRVVYFLSNPSCAKMRQFVDAWIKAGKTNGITIQTPKAKIEEGIAALEQYIFRGGSNGQIVPKDRELTEDEMLLNELSAARPKVENGKVVTFTQYYQALAGKPQAQARLVKILMRAPTKIEAIYANLKDDAQKSTLLTQLYSQLNFHSLVKRVKAEKTTTFFPDENKNKAEHAKRLFLAYQVCGSDEFRTVNPKMSNPQQRFCDKLDGDQLKTLYDRSDDKAEFCEQLSDHGCQLLVQELNEGDDLLTVYESRSDNAKAQLMRPLTVGQFLKLFDLKEEIFSHLGSDQQITVFKAANNDQQAKMLAQLKTNPKAQKKLVRTLEVDKLQAIFKLQDKLTDKNQFVNLLSDDQKRSLLSRQLDDLADCSDREKAEKIDDLLYIYNKSPKIFADVIPNENIVLLFQQAQTVELPRVRNLNIVSIAGIIDNLEATKRHVLFASLQQDFTADKFVQLYKALENRSEGTQNAFMAHFSPVLDEGQCVEVFQSLQLNAEVNSDKFIDSLSLDQKKAMMQSDALTVDARCDLLLAVMTESSRKTTLLPAWMKSKSSDNAESILEPLDINAISDMLTKARSDDNLAKSVPLLEKVQRQKMQPDDHESTENEQQDQHVELHRIN